MFLAKMGSEQARPTVELHQGRFDSRQCNRGVGRNLSKAGKYVRQRLFVHLGRRRVCPGYRIGSNPDRSGYRDRVGV